MGQEFPKRSDADLVNQAATEALSRLERPKPEPAQAVRSDAFRTHPCEGVKKEPLGVLFFWSRQIWVEKEIERKTEVSLGVCDTRAWRCQ